MFGITTLVLRNGFLSLFYRFSTLSLTLVHEVKIFRFSWLNMPAARYPGRWSCTLVDLFLSGQREPLQYRRKMLADRDCHQNSSIRRFGQRISVSEMCRGGQGAPAARRFHRDSPKFRSLMVRTKIQFDFCFYQNLLRF